MNAKCVTTRELSRALLVKEKRPSLVKNAKGRGMSHALNVIRTERLHVVPVEDAGRKYVRYVTRGVFENHGL